MSTISTRKPVMKWHRDSRYYKTYYIGDEPGLGEVYKVDEYSWIGEDYKNSKRDYFGRAKDAKQFVEDSLGVQVKRAIKKEPLLFDVSKIRGSWPRIAGISISRCITTNRPMKRAAAHAHNSESDKHFGWICFFGDNRPLWNGEPSLVFLHEYAHLLNINQGHTKKWMASYRRLLKKFGHENDSIERIEKYYRRRK